MSSIVYGYIHSWNAEPESVAFNEAAISALPDSGALIVRSMFSIQPNSRGHCYYGHLIRFSAYYRGFYAVELPFIGEFELFLESLCWDEAILHHAWSAERFAWESTGSKSVPVQRSRIAGRKHFESAHELREIDWNA